MRVLHISSEYPPQSVYGLGRYVGDLAQESVRQGHQVQVLTNSLGGRDRDVVDRGVAVHRVDFPPPPKPPGAVAPVMAFNLHLAQRAQELGFAGLGSPEVIVSHDWLTARVAHRLARRWEVPHVWTVHDTVLGKQTARPADTGDRWIESIERWAGAAADLVIANSSAISEELAVAYGVDRTRIRVVPCGIFPAAMASSQGEERLQAFRSTMAQRDELLITYAGRLDLEKGIDTLVNAFSQVVQSGLKVRLAIAGGGALAEQIEEHGRRAGIADRIRQVGYLRGELLKAFYSCSDVHVCPSRYEPFGIVALEALSAGVPLVVSDTGGLREIITDHEVGRRVPAQDAGALARCLRELLTDGKLRRRLGKSGQAHANRIFAWSRVSKLAHTAYGEARSTPRPVEDL